MQRGIFGVDGAEPPLESESTFLARYALARCAASMVALSAASSAAGVVATTSIEMIPRRSFEKLILVVRPLPAR
eukprot:3670194-Prymnesium_polylepis.2